MDSNNDSNESRDSVESKYITAKSFKNNKKYVSDTSNTTELDELEEYKKEINKYKKIKRKSIEPDINHRSNKNKNMNTKKIRNSSESEHKTRLGKQYARKKESRSTQKHKKPTKSVLTESFTYKTFGKIVDDDTDTVDLTDLYNSDYYKTLETSNSESNQDNQDSYSYQDNSDMTVSECPICLDKKCNHDLNKKIEPCDEDCEGCEYCDDDDCNDCCVGPQGAQGATGSGAPGPQGAQGAQGAQGSIGPPRTGGIDQIVTPAGNNALLVISPTGPVTTLKVRGTCIGKQSEVIIWESLNPDSDANPGTIRVPFTVFIMGCPGVTPGTFMAFVHSQPIRKSDGTIVNDYTSLKASKATNLPTNGGMINTFLYNCLTSSKDFPLTHISNGNVTSGTATVAPSNSLNIFELTDLNNPPNIGDFINGFVMGPYFCVGTGL